ncbi:peptidoglycan DD-metalloendopeptidase family protein [Streptomyces sp. NPDC057555]|uniref:peptidoglycan DD-metalloendopeptidase family protein n=1 Tax=Streptomyces sp. NPDC057555 TaxID=3346166 RepID=UPI003696888E
MASNRPAPHAPSGYGVGGPADFGGPIGFAGPAGHAAPVGPGGPAEPGDPVAEPSSGAPFGAARRGGVPLDGGQHRADPSHVPFPYGELSDGRPSGEGSLPPEGTSQGALPGGEPVHRPEGDGAGAEWVSGDAVGVDEETFRSLRGKHRVARQRGSGLARGGTALGVGVIAAVGASGVAAAEGRPPVPISMPDPGGAADDAAAHAPTAAATATTADVSAPAAHPRPGDTAQGAGPAEALRHRILQQGGGPQESGAPEEEPAGGQAVQDAPEGHGAQGPTATAEKATGEAPATAAPAAGQSAHRATDFVAPVASAALATGFGQISNRWAADHTGQDFTAPTGTLVRAVHDGTLTQAGWTGAYGYRSVLTLDDGTELWFCHLSSLVRASGRVHAGEVIGRVGATGHAATPHLHLEVRPHGGAPTDPVSWLRDRGVGI